MEAIRSFTEHLREDNIFKAEYSVLQVSDRTSVSMWNLLER